MFANQRREKILDMIREDGQVKVAHLSRIFKVTEVTIRQDLERLEEQGVIVREHGGAILSNARSNVMELQLANQQNMEAKQAIAAEAIKLIHDGDTIILDSGSTTTEIARLITGFHNLRVITNALNIAMILGRDPSIDLNVTGGEFKSPTLSLTGDKAAEYFSNIHADKLFLATAGINLRTGLTYPSTSDLVVKKAMIEAADVVYLAADSTKIGKSSFASLGALSLVDYIITDSQITQEQKKMFTDYDVKHILAQL
ncbi:MAG: DeoR/GlpR transcriptional regulator [Prevotella sp.]|nr:DeoR/GlpR transcriptional regulator [Prevotella sp.]MBQ6209251.1 DeoR/GlpR transcriptional regulator [Prevotella sp.]